MSQHDLTVKDIPLTQLNLLEGNPRLGDVDAVAESMEANGVYQPIIVNRGTHTGREMEIIAGNHRYQAAAKLGHKTIPAIILDLTEEEATRIALADNRTSDLAEYDNEALMEMLNSLDTLDGTGYDEETLDELREELENLDTPPDWDEAFSGVEEKDQDTFYRSFTLAREQANELDIALDKAQAHLTGDEPGSKIAAALAYIAMDFNER